MEIKLLICSAKCNGKQRGDFMNKNDNLDKIKRFQPKIGEMVCYAIVIMISLIFRLLKFSAWYALVLLPIIFGIRLYYTHFHKRNK